MVILVVIALGFLIIEVINHPDKHKPLLWIGAIIYAIIGAFFDATDATDEITHKKE